MSGQPPLRILWLLLFLGLVTDLYAQEWTRFRGPNGTGLSDAAGIPTKWQTEDYIWKAELPAGGHSSPVIWKDLVFLTGADEENSVRSVFAVSTTTGKVVWQRDFPLALHNRHKLNSFASPTCAVDEGRVYASWTTPSEYTVKAFTHDGVEVWSKSLGSFVSQHSGGVSPVVFEELLIVGNEQDQEGGGESFLAALDRRTGEIVWKQDRDSDVVTYSTPCVRVTPDGKQELLFNSKAHGITGIDPLTGRVNWEVKGIFDKRSVSSPVIAAGDIVIGSCGSGGGGNYVVGVKPGTTAAPDSGSVVYKITRQAPYVPTALAKDDLLFLWADNGIVACVDGKSGETHWQKRVGGTFYGSPICIQDRLYCVNTTGDVVVLAASREFAELAVNPLGELCHSTPAAADNRLYIRTLRHLYCFGTPSK